MPMDDLELARVDMEAEKRRRAERIYEIESDRIIRRREALRPEKPAWPPRLLPRLRDAIRGPLTELSLQVIKSILDGSDPEAKTSDRLRAAEIILDRSVGKAKQSIDVSVKTPDRPIDVSKLSIDQRDVLIALATDVLDAPDAPDYDDEPGDGDD